MVEKPKIEHDIPLPDKTARTLISQLRPGESVLLNLADRPYVQSNASRRKRKFGEEYTVRKINEAQIRVWRVK